MELCSFHNKECEDSDLVTIIELKKGKIKQTKICKDCLASHIKEVNLFDCLPDDPIEMVNLFLQRENNEEENEELECGDKVKGLERKMAAAIKIEDYETAAIIKKEIEKIKSSK